MRRFNLLIFSLMALFAAAQTEGDMAYILNYDNPRIDTTKNKELSVDVDALAFFKNDEFMGPTMKGYTLPGLWMAPKLVYQPLSQVKLELGLRATIYDGAYIYPNFAFRDIATWKGAQYTKFAHFLPYFRAQAEFGCLDLVLGDLYGGQNHQLATPLYAPELNLTADPEMGFQILINRPHYELDAWIDWQSYIFKNDTHQEAFGVGVVQRILWNKRQNPWHFYTPLQVLFQHRGGEIDDTNMGVQTLLNGAVGMGAQRNFNRRVLSRMNMEAYWLFAHQMAGNLWKRGQGNAYYASVSLDLLRTLRMKLGIFGSEKFVPLYGLPLFSTLSTRYEGCTFSDVLTGHFSVEYTHSFTSDYQLGAKAELFVNRTGPLTTPAGEILKRQCNVSYTYGIFFRIRPSFLLHK